MFVLQINLKNVYVILNSRANLSGILIYVILRLVGGCGWKFIRGWEEKKFRKHEECYHYLRKKLIMKLSFSLPQNFVSLTAGVLASFGSD